MSWAGDRPERQRRDGPYTIRIKEYRIVILGRGLLVEDVLSNDVDVIKKEAQVVNIKNMQQ